MRSWPAWPLLALAALTAGCAQEGGDQDPLVVYCPHWVEKRDSADDHGFNLDLAAGNGTPRTRHEQVVAPPELHHLGYPFDVVRVHFHLPVSYGAVAVDAVAEDGSHLVIRDRDPKVRGPQTVDSLLIRPQDGQASFDVHLTSVTQADAPRPGPVTLRWSLKEDPASSGSYHVHYLYRVCGAVTGPRAG